MTTYPWSARIVYGAETASRFSTRLGGGIHHVGGPSNLHARPTTAFSRKRWVGPSPDRTSYEILAGVDVRLTSRLGIRADIEQLLRCERLVYDPLSKGVVGVTWRLR